MLAISFLISSCGPPSIEKQVDRLINTKDYLERLEISYALADSLSPKALELVFGVYKNNKYAKQAVKDMLFRYSKIISTQGFIEQEKAIKCVRLILEPTQSNLFISKTEKINLILYGLSLDDTNNVFQTLMTNMAVNHGKAAMLIILDAWEKRKESEVLKKAVLAFEGKTLVYLNKRLGKDKNIEELMARIGEPAVNSLIEKMKDSDENVRFAAADALVKMAKYNPSAVSSLTDAIDNKSLSMIAQNYLFYIRLGINGTEDLLLKAFDKNFSEKMCLDFVNCGNSAIESGARDIAFNHGFLVFPAMGKHFGPRWGSGN